MSTTPYNAEHHVVVGISSSTPPVGPVYRNKAVMSVASVASHSQYKEASDAPWASCAENEFASCLNWDRLVYFNSYHSPEGVKDKVPHIVRNPIDGDVRGVCPTTILSAGCDPIRDESEQYVQKLVSQGALTILRGVPHPFMHMTPLKEPQMYVQDVCVALKMAHGV